MELPRPVVYIKILSPITVGLSSVMGDHFSCKMELTGEVYMNEYIGIDIGGTKTAIVRGDENGNDP